MIMQLGEVRAVGIEIISQVNDEFVIETANFNILKNNNEVIESGNATIEDHKIVTLFSAKEVGKFYCVFIYRIGPEVLKAKIIVEVVV